ncbi:MAG: pyridoxamine kinase [Spirochaetales bacterium]|nr:pyridoxamine kinase [Spirochaetales bacterium]
MYKPNPVPKTAAIHDLSGFGRASLTSIIPILSTMGIQVCPVPTAILSTHTSDFKDYFFFDFTEHMEAFIKHWESLNIEFDAIYSGFLGSDKQVKIVREFIKSFRKKNQIIIVDPVLGDDGITYDTITENLVTQMKELVKHADVITPNVTEAALLLNEAPSISADQFSHNLIKDWLKRLSDLGPEMVIITSIPVPEHPKLSSVVAYDRTNEKFWQVQCTYIPAYFPGTGDIFTSVITGSLLKGDSLPIALDRSVQFVTQAIRASFGHNYPRREGVLLESVLDNLRAPIINASYEIF